MLGANSASTQPFLDGLCLGMSFQSLSGFKKASFVLGSELWDKKCDFMLDLVIRCVGVKKG